MLQGELQALEVAVREFKRTVKVEVLKLLGVDRMVKRAFSEGFHMGRELDPGSWNGHEQAGFYGYWGCWKSKEEAWANSDSEELFSEPVKIRT